MMFIIVGRNDLPSSDLPSNDLFGQRALGLIMWVYCLAMLFRFSITFILHGTLIFCLNLPLVNIISGLYCCINNVI